MDGHSQRQDGPIRILHVLRAPLGGLFRHVVDLTRGQIARGHDVGLVCDDRLQDPRIEAQLQTLQAGLRLGLSRVRIERNPTPGDVKALLHVLGHIHRAQPQVVHGHGSKGGALARIAGFIPGQPRIVHAYTPHGGSLNYRPGSIPHGLYMAAERIMRRRTELLIFESGFVASRYGQAVGRPPRLNRVIHNGLAETEFVGIVPNPDAADFVYIGELRSAKGIDTLLMALASVSAMLDRRPSLALVGSGPDREALQHQAESLRLAQQVTFHGAMPVRDGFKLGRVMVVPSRAESLPYVVLEAVAASMPIVATNVGGIPEIFGPMRRRLIPPDKVPDLAEAMTAALQDASGLQHGETRILADYVRSRFSLDRMVDGVLAAYREAIATPAHGPVMGAPPHPMLLSS